MKEHYVSRECAQSLKRLGFDWKVDRSCIDVIKESAREEWDEEECRWCTVYNCNSYPKPRLDQAAAWIREQWGTYISVKTHLDYSDDADGRRCAEWHFWTFDLMSVGSGEIIDDSDVEYESYEEALSAGISAFLESLEEDIRANELLEKEKES